MTREDWMKVVGDTRRLQKEIKEYKKLVSKHFSEVFPEKDFGVNVKRLDRLSKTMDYIFYDMYEKLSHDTEQRKEFCQDDTVDEVCELFYGKVDK